MTVGLGVVPYARFGDNLGDSTRRSGCWQFRIPCKGMDWGCWGRRWDTLMLLLTDSEVVSHERPEPPGDVLIKKTPVEWIETVNLMLRDNFDTEIGSLAELLIFLRIQQDPRPVCQRTVNSTLKTSGLQASRFVPWPRFTRSKRTYKCVYSSAVVSSC